ncbi:MAG: response regulator transcription factor, partial [Noviherbaspirillum sp.]
MNRLHPIVHVVDRDDGARRDLSLLLGAAGIAVKTYADHDRFIAQFEAEKCGVILLDMSMSDTGGIQILTALSSMNAPQPVIVLVDRGTVDLCRLAFKSGAIEFLEKPVQREVLLEILRQCLTNQVLQHAHLCAARKARERYASLTEREREVLGMVVAGLTSREIGAALTLSPRTVEVHRAHLC